MNSCHVSGWNLTSDVEERGVVGHRDVTRILVSKRSEERIPGCAADDGHWLGISKFLEIFASTEETLLDVRSRLRKSQGEDTK